MANPDQGIKTLLARHSADKGLTSQGRTSIPNSTVRGSIENSRTTCLSSGEPADRYNVLQDEFVEQDSSDELFYIPDEVEIDDVFQSSGLNQVRLHAHQEVVVAACVTGEENENAAARQAKKRGNSNNKKLTLAQSATSESSMDITTANAARNSRDLPAQNPPSNKKAGSHKTSARTSPCQPCVPASPQQGSSRPGFLRRVGGFFYESVLWITGIITLNNSDFLLNAPMPDDFVTSEGQADAVDSGSGRNRDRISRKKEEPDIAEPKPKGNSDKKQAKGPYGNSPISVKVPAENHQHVSGPASSLRDAQACPSPEPDRSKRQPNRKIYKASSDTSSNEPSHAVREPTGTRSKRGSGVLIFTPETVYKRIPPKNPPVTDTSSRAHARSQGFKMLQPQKSSLPRESDISASESELDDFGIENETEPNRGMFGRVGNFIYEHCWQITLVLTVLAFFLIAYLVLNTDTASGGIKPPSGGQDGPIFYHEPII